MGVTKKIIRKVEYYKLYWALQLAHLSVKRFGLLCTLQLYS